MSTIITRVFETEAQAMAAVTALRDRGFADDAILVSRPPAAGAAATQDVAAVLRQAGVSKPAAQACAQRLAQGGAAVTVRAVYGQGRTAIDTLAEAGGIDAGGGDTVPYQSDSAAPLSSILSLPVLWNNPAPFSSWLNFNTISERQKGKARLMRQGAPFSEVFGVPTKSRNPAPFSSLLCLRLLSHKAAPFSAMLGMPTRATSAAPFSAMLGIRTLSSNPAPFSSLFGLPLLSRGCPRRGV